MSPSRVTRRRCSALVVVVFFGMNAGGWPASAEDVEAIIRHGIELRKIGKDREALAEFERARAIQETPRLLAQIGLAEFALGLWLLAEEHLTEALIYRDDAWIKRHRAVLADSMANVSAHLGTVEVWGEPAGAHVMINGRTAGSLPAPPKIRVVAGASSLVVRAAGHEDLSRQLLVRAGEHVRENVQLVRTTLPASRLAATPHPMPARDGTSKRFATSPPSGATPEAAPEAFDPNGGLTRQWWFWTAIGGVIVAGAVSAYLLTRPQSALGCPSGVECPP